MKLNILKTRFAMLVIAVMVTCISSCKKDDMPAPTPDPYVPAPVVASISPSHGPANTSVVITGLNFSNTLSSNIVKFNGKQAIVTSATTTQLTVTVPVTAGTGNILVKVTGSSEVSGPVFTYEYTGIVTTLVGDLAGSIFQFPTGLTIDNQDNIYVADMLANKIKKVTPAGVVSVLAGSGVAGYLDGPGTLAKFNYPWAVKCDAAGNVYVSDKNNCSIRKITPSGDVTTFAGNGTPGYINGTGTAARFNQITGLTFDASGNLYTADYGNYSIRKITTAGVVSTVIYNPFASKPEATHGFIVDASGIYACQAVNHRIKRYFTDGSFWEIGWGTAGFLDGSYSFGRFWGPSDIVADTQGNFYVSDTGNGSIRKLTNGVISTLAGNGTKAYADGVGSAARFGSPSGIVMDKHGNLIVADATNHVIRKIVIQ